MGVALPGVRTPMCHAGSATFRFGFAFASRWISSQWNLMSTKYTQHRQDLSDVILTNAAVARGFPIYPGSSRKYPGRRRDMRTFIGGGFVQMCAGSLHISVALLRN